MRGGGGISSRRLGLVRVGGSIPCLTTTKTVSESGDGSGRRTMTFVAPSPPATAATSGLARCTTRKVLNASAVVFWMPVRRRR